MSRDRYYVVAIDTQTGDARAAEVSTDAALVPIIPGTEAAVENHGVERTTEAAIDALASVLPETNV